MCVDILSVSLSARKTVAFKFHTGSMFKADQIFMDIFTFDNFFTTDQSREKNRNNSISKSKQ